jgi:hypothetical protein
MGEAGARTRSTRSQGVANDAHCSLRLGLGQATGLWGVALGLGRAMGLWGVAPYIHAWLCGGLGHREKKKWAGQLCAKLYELL